MKEEILVPALGESITEATVSKWLKNSGDKVTADEPIVELETDKVNLEVPSPVDGVISEIKSQEGQSVQVGSVLGIVLPSDEKNSTNTEDEQKITKPKENKKNFEETKKENPKTIEDNSLKIEKTVLNDALVLTNEIIEEKKSDPLVLSSEEKTPDPLVLSSEEKTPDPLVLSSEEKKDPFILSPAVRKIVSEKKINIDEVQGSGKDGRILKGDLINSMGQSPKPSERKIKYGPEERVKMTRLRQTIAKRLKEAQENAAILTTFNEVDMTNIIIMRKENQEDFQKRYGIKLGFMSFFVKSCILGLKSFPAINAEIEGQEIIYKNYYNISFAVGTDRGLVVPVLKNADELSFAEIEKNIKIISEKAKSGSLSIEDLQGGTFTISNGGVYGSMLSTPILNPPQSAVLGMHNIVERPIVIEKQMKIRPIMYLALSYDHRIIDGKESVSFLKMVKENLEDPRRLFLDI